MAVDLFRGRRLVIATMHKKEEAIVPAIEGLGATIVVPNDFDTDRFGTFSGEIERTLSPLDAARAKCKAACEAYGCTLAIASEGSFGPHPSMFFVPADDEILVLVDLEHGIEVKARMISCDTNFAGDAFHDWEAVEAFAQKAMFPSHALVVRSARDSMIDVVKGVQQWEELACHCKRYLYAYGQVFVETDMRAMYNPSRMKVIEALSHKLLEKIQSACPQCACIGYDVSEVKNGLPCSLCGSPTASTLSHVYVCQSCQHTEERLYPKGKTEEEPTYCDRCNP